MSAQIIRFPYTQAAAEVAAELNRQSLDGAVEAIKELLDQIDALRFERDVLMAQNASHRMATVQPTPVGGPTF